MNTPKPPTITGSQNLNDLNTNKFRVNSGLPVDYTFESIVQLLQSYGLASEYNWSQQAGPLISSGSVDPAKQGFSVDISTDGNTMVIGAPNENGLVGATWVWARNGTNWVQEAGPLVGAPYISNPAKQGSAVAISGDGNTIVIGGPEDNALQGAAWVFVRSNGVWSQQGPPLISTGNTGAAKQASSLAISQNGNTIVIGGPNNNVLQGAVWVWTRSNGLWSQQAGPLISTGNTGPAKQGSSVAISSDGTTIAVGGPGNDSDKGGVWIWKLNGVWAQESGPLVSSNSIGSSQQGGSVSLSTTNSDNELTLVIGAPNNNSNEGAIWIWKRVGVIWSGEIGPLVGTSSTPSSCQGFSVDVDDEATQIVVGGPYFNNFSGCIWIYKYENDEWVQDGSRISGANGTILAQQGISTAISGNGSTVVIGGSNNDNNQGAFWIFTKNN